VATRCLNLLANRCFYYPSAVEPMRSNQTKFLAPSGGRSHCRRSCLMLTEFLMQTATCLEVQQALPYPELWGRQKLQSYGAFCTAFAMVIYIWVHPLVCSYPKHQTQQPLLSPGRVPAAEPAVVLAKGRMKLVFRKAQTARTADGPEVLADACAACKAAQ
jgi:hypothetical protein